MTGVDISDDLATLLDYARWATTPASHKRAVKNVEAELSRLREQRDALLEALASVEASRLEQGRDSGVVESGQPGATAVRRAKTDEERQGRQPAPAVDSVDDNLAKATCPGCGIPLVWCRRVTSNPDHCWRWDYEQFETMMSAAEAELSRLREQRDAALRIAPAVRQVIEKALRRDMTQPPVTRKELQFALDLLPEPPSFRSSVDGMAALEAAEARCARLQQALTLIECAPLGRSGRTDGEIIAAIREIAREALAGQPAAAEGPDTPADSPRGIRPVIAPWPKKPAWDAATDSTRIECDGSQAYEVIGKPVVLHYANGWGYWVGTYLRAPGKALTDCHSTPDGALEELAARARIEHGIPRRGAVS